MTHVYVLSRIPSSHGSGQCDNVRVKASQRAPNAAQLVKDRESCAPTDEDLKAAIHTFIDHVVAHRTQVGLQQQEVAKASGIAPGHMSNIERHISSVTLETFLRLAHGLGLRPSELAWFLDGSARVTTSAFGRRILVPDIHGVHGADQLTVPVIAQANVSAKALQDATAEAASIVAKRRKALAGKRGSDAKVPAPNKKRNR